MKISVLVKQHMAVLPIGCVLTDEQVERSLRDAARQYCGCADLASGEEVDDQALIGSNVAQDVEINTSEMSLIRPLWLLYLERENSMALEASRSQGAELFGRSVAEVQMAIQDYEMRLPQLAFSEDWTFV
ncbi:hypothetical protein [Pseudomonas sp. TWP3-2]|uniref:hypothetical protein n=1 Tax=Pseudomonas sp. TWP3-2 TaxID=2804574 RepID=UPI003CEBB8DD